MMPTFHKFVVAALVALLTCDEVRTLAADTPRRPNVVLLITDDQGYGDLSCHGNRILKTPQLDELYRQSVRLTNFHVDPTCSPTRAALMTGRYSTRVGVWHTVMGRSMPRAEERMMPQAFIESGYVTAMYGKWHLGDCFPFRPQDRGFQETLVHGGGGVGQIPDYWGNTYFNDTYLHNGQPEKFSGYCTDVFFQQAMQFIEANRERPFFVYLATNAPHSPYVVGDEWRDQYVQKVGPDKDLAKFYGMIANYDHNVGLLRNRLTELGLAENTIVIFMTDNGTARGATFTDVRGNDSPLVSGFNAGMRGRKGSPYEGGHRVPCFVHWPQGKLTGGRDVNGLAAHLDLLPTLIDLCDLKPAQKVAYDGQSLRDALTGKDSIAADRLLISHHQEVPDPEKYRFASVIQGRWRLVLRNDLLWSEKPNDAPANIPRTTSMQPTAELYDVAADPGQKDDVAKANADVVASLRKRYDAWWDGFAGDFGRPAEIVLGDDRQNPLELTCFDWHASQKWWQDDVRRGFEGNGYWTVRIAQAGKYEFTLRRWPPEVDAPITGQIPGTRAINARSAKLTIGAFDHERPIEPEAREVKFEAELPAGSARLQTWLLADDGKSRGAYYVTVRRLTSAR